MTYLSDPKIQSTFTQALRDKLLTGNTPLMDPIIYRAVTTTAAAQEIFVENIPNYRLQLPPNSVGIFQWIGTAFNVTLGTGTTHGNVAAVSGSFVARRAQTAFALVGAAVGTDFIFTANDTTDEMVCTVTPGTTDRIIWECALTAFSVSANALIEAANGIYNGIQ